MEHRPTIFVVDDDKDLRDSVVRSVGVLGVGVRCFAAADDMLGFCQPDMHGCMILDMHLQGMNALELHRALLARGCQQPFIVMTARGDIPSAVAAMHAGALDFIERPFRRERLLDRIQEGIARDAELRRLRAEQANVGALLDALTGRELQILQLVGAGRITKEIARTLGISHKTVEVHRSNIMKKMQVESAAELLYLIARYSAIALAGRVDLLGTRGASSYPRAGALSTTSGN